MQLYANLSTDFRHLELYFPKGILEKGSDIYVETVVLGKLHRIRGELPVSLPLTWRRLPRSVLFVPWILHRARRARCPPAGPVATDGDGAQPRRAPFRTAAVTF